MKRTTMAAAAAAIVLLGSFPAKAVTLAWDDLTDAQQEQAYKDLESENESLRQQLGQLQVSSAGTGETSTNDDTYNGGNAGTEPSGTAADTAQSASDAQSLAVKDVDSFLADISKSFDARQETARRYTNEQVASMSQADMWAFRFKCADAEKDFYDSYSSAQFNDLNILYLCTEYCGGLKKQFDAEEVWNESQDSDKADKLYTAGYYNRAYALVELAQFYSLNLADEYQNLKNAVSQMDALSGEETRNAGADPAKVRQVQELLNEVGFRCGTPDGIAGRQTASSIERFQKMYGFDPADGIIDDQLVTDLSSILSKQQG